MTRAVRGLVTAATAVALATAIDAADTKPARRPNTALSPRITQPFDGDWRFLKADAPGAERPAFDDSAWRVVELPHDWSIEGPYDERNATGRGGGYLPSGVSFYRKRFAVPPGGAGRRVFLELDGVMAGSDVWINGFLLGHRPYGYVSFRYELTGHLRTGKEGSNVVAVRTETTVQPASRWYTGQGLYRHVRLVATNAVHVDQWGVFVSTPVATADGAVVHVQTTVVNQGAAARQAALRTTVLGPDGKTVQVAEAKAQTIPPGGSVDFQQDVPVRNPQLWDLDRPRLYRAVSTVLFAGQPLDQEVTSFGIRAAVFDAGSGFSLNGRKLKLKGVCLHHDGGAFGAAVPLGVWQRRLELLRQVGVNAIRTAHNPPAPEFLDLTDRMGFLVMDETFDAWTMAKPHAEQGYQRDFAEWWERDTRDVIRRDRNHPSIVVYSAGNEIHDLWNAELAFRLFTPMRDLFHRLDPTRPVTLAVLRPNVGHVYDNGFAELMDVVGQNYRENELIAAHAQKPERKVLGTENGHGRDVWLALRDNPFYSGQFLWSGIDYLGEADWPEVTNGSGLLDRTGAFRPRTYQRQSWWSDKPMVYLARRVAPAPRPPTDPGYEPPTRNAELLFSDWSPRDRSPHVETVEAYSNCDEVELFLNGRSLGAQPRPADDAPRTWPVPFEAGALRAIGRTKDGTVVRHELRTAGPPKRIVLASERASLSADRDDVGAVTATVVDEEGVEEPWSDDLITFTVTGPGAIAAVDNGDRSSHEPFLARERHAFRGRCLAFLRATAPSGRIAVQASAPGLGGASISLQAIDPVLPTVFLIGDSTVRNGDASGANGQWGWGEPVAAHFDSRKVNLVNRAIGGRSSRTFQTEGRWERVLAEMKPGDFVIMQFGHNDGGELFKGNRPRGSLKGVGDETEAGTVEMTGLPEVVHSYGWYMRRYVRDAKARGVNPIVCSPVPRKIWKDGRIVRAADDYGGWAAAVARSEGIPFVDLNEIIARRYEALGPEKVEGLFADEHTHTNAAGAELNAAALAEGLLALKSPLAAYLAL